MAISNNSTVAVIGLGYVGLPLAVHFGRIMPTIGFDINATIVSNANSKYDPTGEVSEIQFQEAAYFKATTDPKLISQADYIVVAVPTPIDIACKPDLSLIEKASETVGRQMKKGSIVIYESTVYPGVTEELCVPILEKRSGLVWKKDFHVGYSPERINPGDKEHSLSKIVKVVSGDNPETLESVKELYELIVDAGVHPTRSIREAEAAKVIENTQRDLNIALMNELAIIFDKMDIDTSNVLEAAGTKWNFLPFTPGLVGGHCIGVDPYYLTHKAQTMGYHPEIILSGRRINDSMGKYVAQKAVKMMINRGFKIKQSKIGILGLTFKENCPDLRNTKVIDIIKELESFGARPLVHDPWADPVEARHYLGVELVPINKLTELSGLIIAVPHHQFKTLSVSDLTERVLPGGAVVDIKSILNQEEMQKSGLDFWRL